MIEPWGAQFATLPVAYFRILGYLLNTGTEGYWAGGLFVDGGGEEWSPGWDNTSPPTLHGPGIMFWAANSNIYGTGVTLFACPSSSADGTRVTTASLVGGSLWGGMDDLLIYRPTDLFARTTVEGRFGYTWTRQEESFLVTHDSGFMDVEASCQAWIHCLEPYPEPEFIYSGGTSDGMPALVVE